MNIIDYEIFDENLKYDQIVNFIKSKKLDKKPILLNIESKRVATNFIATRELLCKYLNIRVEELAPFLAKLGFDGEVLKSKDIYEYDSIRDVSSLPIPKYYPKDAGRYITAGVVISALDFEDLNSYNASIHRMLVINPKKLAIRLVPPRHTYMLWKNSIDKGEDLEIAIAIGTHPLFMFSASTRVPEGKEFGFAGKLMKKLELSEIDGIYCPESEIIIRGRITGEMVDEGPFVDITGTYDKVRKAPVVEVDKVFVKEDFIYYSITPAGYEHQLLMGVPCEPEIYKGVSKVCDVKNVVMTPGGRHWLHAIIQIRKITEGDGKNAIISAFASHPSLKHVVVVDEDIDIYNIEDIEYAIATRFQADKDLIIIKGARGSSLDPSALDNITAKMGIDATKPLDNDKFERII